MATLSMTSCLSLAVLMLMLVHYVWSYFQRKRKLAGLRPRCTVPDGPRGHWLVGHSSLPAEMLSSTFGSWSKTHGPLFEVYLIPKLFSWGIIINDVDLVKEMCKSPDFAHRDNAKTALRRVFDVDFEGILSGMWTPRWKDLRKFTVTALSELGFGKAAMETQIVEEADKLVEAMLKTGDKPQEPLIFIRFAVSNVISRLVFGIRTEIGESSSIHNQIEIAIYGLLYLLIQPVYNLFPWLMDYFQTGTLKDILKADIYIRKYIDEAMEEHEKTLGEEEEPRDFIDAVIIERRKRKDNSLSTSEIRNVITELFGAGSDSMTSALDWTIAWLLHYPDIKAKLREEMIQVMGLSGTPTVSAMSRCHYHLAFFDEMLRCSSVSDFTFYHRPTKPVVKLGGHLITEEKLILGNIWACHNDPRVWEEPEKFRPERHLDDHGRYKKSENVLGFGTGTRRCIGEKLARLELFVFTVRLNQRVDIQLAPGEKLPDMFGRMPFFRHPDNYKVVVKPASMEE